MKNGAEMVLSSLRRRRCKNEGAGAAHPEASSVLSPSVSTYRLHGS